MVKCYHDWNSDIERWESDGRVFKELKPIKPKIRLMDLFAFDFVHFDGCDWAEIRGTITIHDDRRVHTVFSSDVFQKISLGVGLFLLHIYVFILFIDN
jgi:hypothetical protein